MFKNAILLLLTGLFLCLAGCARSGSTETSYIDLPNSSPKPTQTIEAPHCPLIVNVYDIQNRPFTGATLLLVNNNTDGTEYSLKIEDIACSFEKIPFGEYTISIPGYSQDSHDFTVDENYTVQDFVFSRIDVDVAMAFSGTAYGINFAEAAEFQLISLSDGINDIELLYNDFFDGYVGLFAWNKETGTLDGTLPAGTYYLQATHLDGPLYYGVVEVNSANSKLTIAVREIDNQVIFYLPIQPNKPKLLLDGQQPAFMRYSPYNPYFYAIFLPENEKSAQLTVSAAGFEDYENTFNIVFSGDPFTPTTYDVLLTPSGKNKTKAVVCVNTYIEEEDASVIVTLNNLQANLLFYSLKGLQSGNPSYRAIFYLDASQYQTSMPLEIKKNNTTEYSGNKDIEPETTTYCEPW